MCFKKMNFTKIWTLLFLFVSLFATPCNLIDPGTVLTAYGLRVDTSRLMNKILSAFNVQNNLGPQIRFRKSGRCLDADRASSTSTSEYSPFPNNCDSYRRTQRWHTVSGTFVVGNKATLPNVDGNSPCLDCASGTENCEIIVDGCKGKITQQFLVRVHPSQIDLAASRVYFSLHSRRYGDRCLNYNQPTDSCYLEECSGSVDQSFYIRQNYANEIQTVRSTVMVCANSDSGTDVFTNEPFFRTNNKTIFL